MEPRDDALERQAVKDLLLARFLRRFKSLLASFLKRPRACRWPTARQGLANGKIFEAGKGLLLARFLKAAKGWPMADGAAGGTGRGE